MSETASSAEDKAHADVAIVCALALELAPLLERCERVRKYTGGDFVFRGGRFDEIRIAVVESGIGFARARRATQALIDAHTPPWVLACGFAGALRPGMQVGDIVMADTVADVHGNELNVDLKLPAGQPGLHGGRILTADHVVRTVAEKRQLAEAHGAIAVDMESLAVAQVCRETQRKFLAIRVISDDLSADLPPEVLSLYGATGTMRVGAALGAVWKRPSSVKDMWRLREMANRSADRLATFLEGVLPQLYAAGH